MIESKKIDVVVLNGIVVAGQIYDMTTEFSKVNVSIEVWDRVDLILKIFARHANTAEAKLQIELAAMRHMGPRIFGMGMELSRQGGGIGTRGIGETNTELMKRHWRKEMKNSRERLKKITRNKEEQIERRRAQGIKTVSLIGYTNAGKTSLFNTLTHKNKLQEDKLFATLESYTGPLFLPKLNRQVLVSDTIGFIRDLPPVLIDAFHSTLLESIHADVLLHVIDISDKDYLKKIEVVEQTLKGLNLQDKNIIYVFNKIDKLESGNIQPTFNKLKQFNPQYVSAYTRSGVNELIQSISFSLA
jgi:GTPase